MLSRVANSIYWMSRYLERAENVARFIAVNVHLMLDMGLDPDNTQWKPLVVTTGDDADFDKRYKNPSEKNVIQFLTFDPKNLNSILSCIQFARENARTVREILSTEVWEQINDLYHYVQKNSRKRRIDDLQAFYTHIRTYSHLITGLCENTMSHGEGWHFAQIGRMLERADKTARILDVKYFLLLPNPEYVDSPYDAVQWGAVLKSANAFEMYRKHFHRVSYKDVTEFLIFDTEFPRSMAYCVNAAANCLDEITKDRNELLPAIAEMTKLQKSLLSTSVETVLANGLHEFIDIFQFNLNIVDHAIHQSFFDVAAA
jgi:uncharacterized alpha-E superfamily protein